MNDQINPAAMALDLSERSVDEDTREAMRQSWRKSDAEVCSTCWGPAYQETADSLRVGCPTCGFTTINPGIRFRPKVEQV